MKNRKVISFIAILMAILLALSLVISVIPARAYAVTQEDVDDIQGRRDELAGQAANCQDRIDQLQEEQAAVIEQKALLDERSEYAREQIRLTREMIDLYSEMIREKEAEVLAAKENEADQLERYRVRIRAMEEAGGYNILSILFSVRSLGELLTAIDDINEIMKSDKELEERYIAARENSERVLAEYEDCKKNLESKQEELNGEIEELEKQIKEASELIESLQEDIDKAIKEYEAAEAARAAASYQMDILVAELNRQNARLREQQTQPQQPTGGNEDQPVGGNEGQSEEQNGEEEEQESGGSEIISAGSENVTGTGSLAWPVPCSTTVTSRFGPRIHPITGEYRNHNGMDIDGYGHDGYPIVCCDDGVVVVSEYNDSYGNYVMVDHGNGMQTLYAHMSGRAVSVGQIVKKNDTLGYLGSTGWATGTHCHLEIFVGGSRVDPESYFGWVGLYFYDC